MKVVEDSRVAVSEAKALLKQSLLFLSSGAAKYQKGAETLTVFVHGYFSWPGIFEPMARELGKLGLLHQQHHFRYAPVGSVADHAQTLAREIQDLRPRGPVRLVGHSLGGILGRYVHQVLGCKLDALVCLATPHRGTRVAERWSKLPLTGEIKEQSETLRRLERTRATLQTTRVCNIVAEEDQMVQPTQNAHLDEHETVYLKNVGHHGVVFDPRAWALTAQVLREVSGAGLPLLGPGMAKTG